MINDNSSPTERTRHIDVQFFQIQDWRIDGDIIMLRIPGVLNISDAEIKLNNFRLFRKDRNTGKNLGVHAFFSTIPLMQI